VFKKKHFQHCNPERSREKVTKRKFLKISQIRVICVQKNTIKLKNPRKSAKSAKICVQQTQEVYTEVESRERAKKILENFSNPCHLCAKKHNQIKKSAQISEIRQNPRSKKTIQNIQTHQ